jgi:hypothetical protein
MQRWPFTPAPVRAAWRWARGVRLALVILILATALAAGINFLSHQNWGPSGETFSCNPGQSLTWHDVDHGNATIIECVPQK